MIVKRHITSGDDNLRRDVLAQACQLAPVPLDCLFFARGQGRSSRQPEEPSYRSKGGIVPCRKVSDEPGRREVDDYIAGNRVEQSGERELGTSDWHEITQEQINLFAEATGDHQWIHVDPEAAANGPFGTTVAHGYLTLSMLPMLLSEVVSVSDAVMGVNYGTEKIRFTSPVPSGSRVRLHGKLLRTERRGPSVVWYVGIQIEIEDKEKPALVGEVVYMAAGAPDA